MNKPTFKLGIKAPEQLFADGTLRREVLNAEWFTTTRQAQVVINGWLKQYNHTRPHQALNMRPRAPETLRRNGPAIGG
jgi:putative transposase